MMIIMTVLIKNISTIPIIITLLLYLIVMVITIAIDL